MSDERFKREPGDDSDEEPKEVPGKPYVDPKPRAFYTPKPPFDLAKECEEFLRKWDPEPVKKKGGRS